MRKAQTRFVNAFAQHVRRPLMEHADHAPVHFAVLGRVAFNDDYFRAEQFAVAHGVRGFDA